MYLHCTVRGVVAPVRVSGSVQGSAEWAGTESCGSGVVRVLEGMRVSY